MKLVLLVVTVIIDKALPEMGEGKERLLQTFIYHQCVLVVLVISDGYHE